MPFDYKKEYKAFYHPSTNPGIVNIPQMNFAAVRGCGDPNEEGGQYKNSIGLLYGILYTVKMSKKGDYNIKDYHDFVVPPLEGFWWQEGVEGADYAKKSTFRWVSLLRLPDFVNQQDFDWAAGEAARKKKLNFSQVEFFTYTEGLCVQCMHLGPYDDEPATIARMDDYAKASGYEIDISPQRYHHEIYVTDARKGDATKLKTVIRHPVKPILP